MTFPELPGRAGGSDACMIGDGLLCRTLKLLGAPRFARWTAVVVDRDSGQDHAMPDIRFRWRRSVTVWIAWWSAHWDRHGIAVRIEPRRLP